jgi:hypothetical protein
MDEQAAARRWAETVEGCPCQRRGDRCSEWVDGVCPNPLLSTIRESLNGPHGIPPRSAGRYAMQSAEPCEVHAWAEGVGGKERESERETEAENRSRTHAVREVPWMVRGAHASRVLVWASRPDPCDRRVHVSNAGQARTFSFPMCRAGRPARHARPSLR